MGMFKAFWMTDDAKKCDKVVEAMMKLSNESELAQIAEQAPLSKVRLAAVDRLAQQNVLAHIACTDRDKDVREFAVGKITDNAVLKKLAIEDSNVSVRKTALLKITNEDYLPFDGNIGCEHFNMEHAWERYSDRCVEKCSICGKEREKHIWAEGECLYCGLKLEAVTGLEIISIADLIDPQQRQVVCSALTYALKNWGNPSEEVQIKALIAKIANAEALNKNDVVFFSRVYRLVMKLFPTNKELHIDGIFKLINDIVFNMQ